MPLARQEQAGQLFNHGRTQFFGATNRHGTLVVVGDVVADTDGDQLHGRPRLYPLHHIAQMLLEEAAGIGRKRRFVQRHAIGDDHQNTALLAARQQTLVRPQQCFAIDVLFQQVFLQHQRQVAARTAPRRIGVFVDDVTHVAETAGVATCASLQPILAGLAAFPGAGGEAQNLYLHPATLKRARQHIRAERGEQDRASAHGTAVVQQYGHHRVLEIRLLFFLE